MIFMIRFLTKALYFSLLTVIFLAGIAVFLATTTAGLETLIDLGRTYIPGTLKIHRINGSLLHDFSLETIEYQYKQTQIKINQLNVQWQPGPTLKKHQLTVQWKKLQGALNPEQKLVSSSGILNATTTLPDINLHLNTDLGTSQTEHWQMKARMLGAFPWKWTFDATLSPFNSPTQQMGLHTNISLQGSTQAKDKGKLVLTIHPGYYRPPAQDAMPELAFKGGIFTIALSPKQLSGLGNLMIDANKTIKLAFQLPKFTLDDGFVPSQKLDGELILDIKTLDFLQNISPEIERLKGQLNATLRAKGTIKNPHIESQILLNKTSLYVPKLKLNLDAVDLTIQSKKQRWEAKGAINSAGHNLLLQGNGLLNADYRGEITLEGVNFPLINTSEYQISISPQLKLHLTPAMSAISGSILIPYAQIKLQTFNNSLSLPDEVVYKKQKEESPSFIANTPMDVTIEMGEHVALDVKGLKGHLDGTLTIKQQPQGAMNAYGELSVRDGIYKAYGQDLSIKQGQLIFTGGPIDNPGISLRAAKKINNTPTYTSASQLFDFNSGNLQSVNLGDTITLGVEVSGRLIKPQIQLYSEPAIFSQADILSMLVLGRPASQANKAGGQLLLAAISSMNVGGTNTTQLLEQLKQTSGLDFNVQTNTNYNQLTNTVSDSTAFVVGKSLSKRLYLSYNIGLSQNDPNLLTLKYILNTFFSIQVSTSNTSSAIDVLYTSSKNKKSKPK